MSDFKVVYAIVERGPKKHWLRIGLAFVNRDGSLNVRLDAVPLSGQLHIRDQSPPIQPESDEATPSPAAAIHTQEDARPMRRRGP